MNKFIRKFFLLGLVFILTFSFCGCNKLDKIKVKLGLINQDFQYIKEGRVNKITIQSTRDKGFRFIVEDKKSICDIYDILSSAKKVKTKSTLKPDYIFEMYENDESVHKFKYIAGIDKRSAGNLYDDQNNVYLVSERLDDDIIKNFWNTRVPEKFYKVYYGSIIDTIKKYKTKNPNISTIGIDINNDIEARKFILSTELEQFKSNIKKLGAEVIENNSQKKYDANLVVSTEGYTPLLYKSIITISNNKNDIDTKYYIWDVYEDSNWNIRIFEGKAPEINGKKF